MTVPILFIIFNRPEITQRVFNEIKKQRPEKLYVAADGPRVSISGEVDRCVKTRSIIDQIDWPCAVFTLFREKNLGCKQAVSSAITWFFNHEVEGIILEDDCLPDPTFFSYCAVLLEKYRTQENVMIISGANFQNGIKRSDGSYYFGKNAHIWGWASWRRAWKKYDITMKTYPEFQAEKKIEKIFTSLLVREFWKKTFNAVLTGDISTWDYQWIYAVFMHNGLCVTPNVNLISNIGFGNFATHTKNKNDKFANIKTSAMTTIIHPTSMIRNKKADEYFYRQRYSSIDLLAFYIKHIFKFLQF